MGPTSPLRRGSSGQLPGGVGEVRRARRLDGTVGGGRPLGSGRRRWSKVSFHACIVHEACHRVPEDRGCRVVRSTGVAVDDIPAAPNVGAGAQPCSAAGDRPPRPGRRAAPLPDGLADDLRSILEDELAPVAEHLAEPLWVSKHTLATVHSCEAHFLDSDDSRFDWSPANARGIVAHRAIEIMTHWRGDPNPADLVDETLARMADDAERASIGGYIAGLDEYDRADLRGQAVDRVTAFTECFPPLRPAWRPRTEAKVRAELLDGSVVLSGKVDLSLGRPGEKVIIDLKSGMPRPQHREDLRFYALLETLALGVAPRKLASYYLDAAATHPEDVSEGVLRAAVRRTVDGVHRIVEVRTRARVPERTPGPQCGWCSLLPSAMRARRPGRPSTTTADDAHSARQHTSSSMPSMSRKNEGPLAAQALHLADVGASADQPVADPVEHLAGRHGHGEVVDRSAGPLVRRSPTIDSSGSTSNAFSAAPPPRSRITMRGGRPCSAISKVTSAPNASE